MWRARNRPADRGGKIQAQKGWILKEAFWEDREMTEEENNQMAADLEKGKYFQNHPNAPLDEYQTEEDGDESKAARDRVVADMKAQKEFQDRQKRITEHVRFLDSLGLVDRDYTMSSTTETVVFADELRPGLVVLLEDPNLRAENPKPDSGQTIFANARKNNRWCTIVDMRTSLNAYVTFIGEYEDGTESVRVSRPHDGWLVKLDSVGSADPDEKCCYRGHECVCAKESLSEGTHICNSYPYCLKRGCAVHKPVEVIKSAEEKETEDRLGAVGWVQIEDDFPDGLNFKIQ